jgi:hypothetical protein
MHLLRLVFCRETVCVHGRIPCKLYLSFHIFIKIILLNSGVMCMFLVALKMALSIILHDMLHLSEIPTSETK